MGDFTPPSFRFSLSHSDHVQTVGQTPPTLKYMPPGHFCPDVLDMQDLGEADFLRGKFIRGFMWLMEFWPKPKT